MQIDGGGPLRSEIKRDRVSPNLNFSFECDDTAPRFQVASAAAPLNFHVQSDSQSFGNKRFPVLRPERPFGLSAGGKQALCGQFTILCVRHAKRSRSLTFCRTQVCQFFDNRCAECNKKIVIDARHIQFVDLIGYVNSHTR